MRFCRLARPGGRLGPQTLDLAPRQRHADFTDPFQLHSADWLGIEAGQVDQRRGLSPLDYLEIALAGFQPNHGLLAVEARYRVLLLPINYNDIAAFIFRQHGIARHLKGDGFLRYRKGELDLPETFRRHLL